MERSRAWRAFERLCLMIATAWLTGCGARRVSEVEEPALAIEDVTVLDMVSRAPRPHATVVVRGRHIVAVGDVGSVAVPSNARRVDGRGRYLIPGLWDLHTHTVFAGGSALPVMIAQGVTSIRDLGGDLVYLRRAQDRAPVSPRIFSAAAVLENQAWLDRVAGIDSIMETDHGVPTDGGRVQLYTRIGVETTEDIQRAIDSVVSLGATVVKMRTFGSQEQLHALTDAARRRGLKVAVHFPDNEISLAEASNAIGAGSLEHMFQYNSLLADLTPEARAETYAALVRNGTWLVPTIATEWARTSRPDSVSRRILSALESGADPRGIAFDGPLYAVFERDLAISIVEHADAPGRDLSVGFRANCGWLRELHQAGVRMAAGTDVGALLVLPGYALHDELEQLVSCAGLSPEEALRAGTLNAAQFFGADSLGTIEVGKLADLVLLDADPLADVGNTRRIRAVVADGRYLDRATLDAFVSRRPEVDLFE